MMIALLPPSSRIVRPSRRPTTSATRRPIRQLPVAEISGRRRSASMRSPMSSDPPTQRLEDARTVIGLGDLGRRFAGPRRRSAASAAKASRSSCRRRRPRSWRSTPRPRPGKLNAVMMPIGPSGCHCSIIRCRGALAGDRQSVELARQADGEVAHVDHLLDFALALAADLAGLEGDQQAEVGLRAREAPRRSGGPPRPDAAAGPSASSGRSRGPARRAGRTRRSWPSAPRGAADPSPDWWGGSGPFPRPSARQRSKRRR